jgi:hypothetical protein
LACTGASEEFVFENLDRQYMSHLPTSKEIDLFLHLPIAIAAVLSPLPVSDTTPAFDIVRECRFEGGSIEAFDHCAKDEADALRQLQAEWTQFVAVDKKTCMAETRVGGFASYVELFTCLQTAREARDAKNSAHSPLAMQSPQGRPE